MNTYKASTSAVQKNPKFTVDGFIERLKTFTGCETDYDLAAYFGFKARNQIKQFRSRGSVSSTGMTTIIEKMSGKADFNWLLFGIGTPEIGEVSTKTEEQSEAFLQVLKALGFEAASPEARALNKFFQETIESPDLPPEVVQHEVNKFISELVRYVLESPRNKGDVS